MNFVIQTERGRAEIYASWIRGVEDCETAFCALDTDWKAIPLSIEQAQAIARQDFRRSLQEEHKSGCDLCFWKLAGDAPCDSLCCQLAVYSLRRGVDIRLRGQVVQLVEERGDVGEGIRWGLLFCAVVYTLIMLHNAWLAIRLPS